LIISDLQGFSFNAGTQPGQQVKCHSESASF
jgi:hypothetical protein